MRIRDFENWWRYRRVVRNPWIAATARRRARPGELVPLELQGGGTVSVRSGTSDIRVFKDVFVKDVYDLRRFEGGPGAPFDTVIDVGGHIGLFSVRAAPLARRVIACEPVSSNAELFLRNVQTSGRDNVRLERCALAAKPGELRVYTSRNPGGHSVVPSLREPDARYETVPARTLAELMDRHEVERCSFLKLDCEGGEYGILLESDAGALGRVTRIALEYHDASAEDPRYTGEELARHLSRCGFRVRRLPSSRHRNYGLLHAWRVA